MEHMIVEIDFGCLYRRAEYEWKFIEIRSKGLYYMEDVKYRRVRDVKVYDVMDKDGFKEIHFTVVRKNRSYRMVVLGKVVKMMSRDF